MDVILAVVGSTKFHGDYLASDKAINLIDAAIQNLEPKQIISGEAIGLDSIAEYLAFNWGIDFKAFEPRNKQWEPAGYKERNMLIAEACTHLLCIRHSASKTYGSGWTADYAERLGKQVERYTV